jgi:hypothetical protein
VPVPLCVNAKVCGILSFEKVFSAWSSTITTITFGSFDPRAMSCPTARVAPGCSQIASEITASAPATRTRAFGTEDKQRV